MTDQYGDVPHDEPIIGLTTPPPPPVPGAPPPLIGIPPFSGDYADPETVDGYEDDYDYDDDGYAADGRYHERSGFYDDTPPTRQPMFYVFIALAALVGAAAIFLLVTVARSGNETDESTPAAANTASTSFNVRIESPANGDRFDMGKPVEVNVRATSTEDVARFELFVNERLVDQVAAGSPLDRVYSGKLHTQFDRRGEYSLYVRVSSAQGASKKSDVVKVTAVEDITNRPKEIKGKVITPATLRNGPGDNFEAAGTLSPPAEVRVLGKSDSAEWVFVDVDGGKWVKAIALEIPDLGLVPVKDLSTPTPVRPTATVITTATPTPAPSVTPTPTSAPDFVPVDAVLSAGGAKLTITVRNVGTAPYSGALEVQISGDGGTQSFAFNVNTPVNGSTPVEFTLAQPITTPGKSVRVTVNPSRNPRESNFDNNAATFALAVAVEAPKLSLQANVAGQSINVTLTNDGGPLAAAGAKVTVTLQQADGTKTTSEKTVDLAITKGSPQTISVARPQGTGQAQVAVTVNGQVVASGTIQLQ